MEKSSMRKIQDADLRGKVVLVRVDHNVVKKGLIRDPYRIDATIGTLYYINAKGGKIILMTHVGRPRNKKTGEIKIDDHTSVIPIVKYLQKKLHVRIKVPDFYKDKKRGYIGIETSVNHYIKELQQDEIDMVYLPNTRWFAGEEAKGNDLERFAVSLAGLADIYVNDAFGSWQPHASTVEVAKHLPAYAGYLMQREIENLKRIYEPESPFIAVVAGAKFDTKIEPLFKLLEKADNLVLGGVMYNAYLCAKYGISIKGVSDEDLASAKRFVEFASKHEGKILELPYVVESDTFEGKIKGKYRTHDIRTFKKGDTLNYVLDVDRKSFEEKVVKNIFMKAKTIFVNAVMGLTPHFNDGTIALDELIDKNIDASKLYGGGDTMQELKRLLPGLYIVAIDNPKYYIFTGGGAVLKAIENGTPAGMKPVKMLLQQK